jgi:anti-sigma-K factor RskA
MSIGNTKVCAEIQELATLMALDVLDAASRVEVETHMAGCSDCARVYSEMREAVGVLAYAAPLRTPSPELKARILLRVTTASPTPILNGHGTATPSAVVRPAEPAPIKVRRGLELALIACSVMLAVGLVGSLQRLGSVQGQLADQTAKVAALDAESARMQGELAQSTVQSAAVARDADLLASKDVRMVAMESKPEVKSAQAWVYWSKERHAWLVTFRDLPAAGPQKTYQLWAVTGDKKVSLGIFSADAKGVARVHADLPEDGKPVACAVTVEPDGGVQQPTGPIVMVGPIKSL